MWHGHQFSQRNKISQIAEGGGGGGEGWKQQNEGLDKILKRWGRKYSGVFIT